MASAFNLWSLLSFFPKTRFLGKKSALISSCEPRKIGVRRFGGPRISAHLGTFLSPNCGHFLEEKWPLTTRATPTSGDTPVSLNPTCTLPLSQRAPGPQAMHGFVSARNTTRPQQHQATEGSSTGGGLSKNKKGEQNPRSKRTSASSISRIYAGWCPISSRNFEKS